MKPFAQVAALKPPPLRAMPSGSLLCLMCGMQYSVWETSGWLKGRGVPSFGSRNFVVRKKRQSSVEPTGLQERKWGGRRCTRGSGMHDGACGADWILIWILMLAVPAPRVPVLLSQSGRSPACLGWSRSAFGQ